MFFFYNLSNSVFFYNIWKQTSLEMEKPKTKTLKLKLFPAQNSSNMKKDQENPKKSNTFSIQLQASLDLKNYKRQVSGQQNANFIGDFDYLRAPTSFQEKYEIIEEIGKVTVFFGIYKTS